MASLLNSQILLDSFPDSSNRQQFNLPALADIFICKEMNRFLVKLNPLTQIQNALFFHRPYRKPENVCLFRCINIIRTRLFFTDRNLHSHNKRADKLLDQLLSSIPEYCTLQSTPSSRIPILFSFSLSLMMISPLS